MVRRFLAIALITACTPFEPGSERPAAGDAAAPADAAAAAAAADASVEAGSSEQRPYPTKGILCQSADTACSKEEQCCLGRPPTCFDKGSNACTTTQLNCAGASDCSGTARCCRAGPSTLGTVCKSACTDKVICRTQSECGPGEICRPPADFAAQPWWSCEPCAP